MVPLIRQQSVVDVIKNAMKSLSPAVLSTRLRTVQKMLVLVVREVAPVQERFLLVGQMVPLTRLIHLLTKVR